MAEYQYRVKVKEPRKENVGPYADYVVSALYSSCPTHNSRWTKCDQLGVTCGEFSSDFTYRDICIIADALCLMKYEQFCEQNKLSDPFVTYKQVNGVTVCHFGAVCRNRDKCPYLHPDQLACSFGSKCNKKGLSCTYLHPRQKPCNRHESFMVGCQFYHKKFK